MTSPEPLGFRCVLVTGGGGGIGKALARYFVSKGKKVIIAGRTESNIAAASKEIVTREHPDLDCLVNNAGVQRPLRVLEESPADFLRKADEEINVNIRGPLHLALGLLPHFRDMEKCPHGATIMNVSSILVIVPFSIINPVYNGTKAWLHFWSMNLRTQLQGVEPPIRVIEIAPPSVATDLHRERENPDDNKKENNPAVLSIEEFMAEVSEKLERGDDTISAGSGAGLVAKWYSEFEGIYQKSAADWK